MAIASRPPRLVMSNCKKKQASGWGWGCAKVLSPLNHSLPQALTQPPPRTLPKMATTVRPATAAAVTASAVSTTDTSQ